MQEGGAFLQTPRSCWQECVKFQLSKQSFFFLFAPTQLEFKDSLKNVFFFFLGDGVQGTRGLALYP